MISLYIVIFTGWRVLAGEYKLLKLDSLCFFRPGSAFLKRRKLSDRSCQERNKSCTGAYLFRI